MRNLDSNNVRKSASLYFALQGIGVILWWSMLYFAPSTRVYFQMGESETTLLAFWLPDLLFLGSGSLAAAYLCFTKHKFSAISIWFVTGLMTYAAIYCVSYALMTDTGWLGAVFMTPAMIWCGVFGIGLPPVQDYMFRETKPASTNWILTKTFTQIAVVWSVILFVIPFIITQIEAKIGIPDYAFPFQKIIASVFFVVISSLGVYSAYTMSKVGKGTPLPLDHAPNFVATGAYAYVRNPMALSGIGQGIAVALFLGSPLVFLYAIMGSLIWQVIFRPLEEEDLRERFGKEYEDYLEKVKCWIPNLMPYEQPPRSSQEV